MDLDANINNLPVDLVAIKLQRNDLKIEGKGTIYIKNDQALALKVYIITSENFDPMGYFSQLLESSKKAGEIIGEDAYFKFEGRALTGDIYNCDKSVLVDSINSEIVSVELKDYLYISNVPTFNEFKIGKVVVPCEIRIPTNKVLEINRNYSDKWTTRSYASKLFEIHVDGIDIDILTEPNKTIIFFQSDSKCFSDLNEIYPIVDALGFLSSSIIDRYDVELADHKSGNLKKIICPSFSENGIIKMNQPPLNFNLPGSLSHHYCDLFNNFYFFRTQKMSDELAFVLRQVTGSANSYISTYALTLTTAIELLVKRYFTKYAKEISSDEVAETQGKIENLDINIPLKNRIIGLLESIVGQIRAKDILIELCNNDIICREEYKAWSKLRNATTHGDNMNKSIQEFYDLCSYNLLLFYKLVFFIINYNGLFTDYSEYGHPIHDLKKSAS
jgi:hypothetical protein